MTQPTPGPAAGQEDLAIELTGFEILTLLSLGTDEPGTEGTRKALHLPDIPQDSPLLSAGLSSLIVRKLAVPEPGKEQITPQGKVLVLATILNQATEWVEASGGADGAQHTAVLFKAPTGAALVEPKPYGIWHALPLPAQRPLTDLGTDYVKAAFGDIAQRPFVGAVRVLDGAGTTTRAAALRVDEKGTWELSSGEPDSMPDPVTVPADPTFQVVAKGLTA